MKTVYLTIKFNDGEVLNEKLNYGDDFNDDMYQKLLRNTENSLSQECVLNAHCLGNKTSYIKPRT